MKIKTKIIALFLIETLVLTGCKDVQIWEKKADENGIVALSNKELEKDVYYVKNGTKFYPVFMPQGNAGNFSYAVNESRVMATRMEEEKKIPVHYKSEGVAVASDKNELKTVTLERFKDLGYSFGVYGGKLKEGYFQFDTSSCVIKDSSLAEILKTMDSKEIRLSTINGEKISENMIDSGAGVLTGLKKGESYKVTLFAGTYYYETELVADTHMMKSFEIFNYEEDRLKDTKNGYKYFDTPEDLKSGWYNMNGAGLFKYYNHERGGNDNISMNDNYYENEKARLEAYSKQYSVDIASKTKDVKIRADYIYPENITVSEENIEGYVYSPDGIQYRMEHLNGEDSLSLDLTEAIPGRWTVNIVPKILEVTVNVDSNSLVQDTTVEETVITLSENRTNIVFSAEYEMEDEECEISGIVVAPDGTTSQMVAVERDETDVFGNKVGGNRKRHYMESEMAFASSGNYMVKIFHYSADSTVHPAIVRDNTETETDIIIVESED